MTLVRAVMSGNPETIAGHELLPAAAKRMRDCDTGALVVVSDEGKVTGILTDRDIVVRLVANGQDPSRAKVSDICSTEIAAVGPGDDVEQAFALMRDKAVQRLPVCDAGALVGILTLGDLALDHGVSDVLGAAERIGGR